MKNWIRAQLSYWRLCRHRSHRWNLRCYRFLTFEGFCGKHNYTCWTRCGGRFRGNE